MNQFSVRKNKTRIGLISISSKKNGTDTGLDWTELGTGLNPLVRSSLPVHPFSFSALDRAYECVNAKDTL